MPINNFLLPGAKFIPGYEVANSCRFDGSSAYLRKTFSGTSTDSNKCTMSFWCKKSSNGANLTLLTANIGGSSNRDRLYFDADDKLQFFLDNAGDGNLLTNRVFRDNSAWMHICVAIDTTQGTAANRVKIYINGTQETSFGTESYPAEDYALTGFGHSVEHTIGADDSDGGSNEYYNGYMAEVAFVNGSALAASSFGEFDEDSPTIWKPKDVSGLTFGTNGFYLDFEDSDNLGDDESGNTHDFAETNIAATDQAVDSPTNNFCTMNPLDNQIASSTFSEGNCKVVTSGGNDTYNTASFWLSAGLWYWEIKIVAEAANDLIGIANTVTNSTSLHLGENNFGYGYINGSSPSVRYNNSAVSGWSGTNYGNDDIVMVALDLTNSKLYFGVNGTWDNSGDPTSGSTGTGAVSITAVASTPQGAYTPAVGEWHNVNTFTYEVNFGSPPYAISSGNADGNGYGNFEYAVPSGYYALCTKNLAEYG